MTIGHCKTHHVSRTIFFLPVTPSTVGDKYVIVIELKTTIRNLHSKIQQLVRLFKQVTALFRDIRKGRSLGLVSL